MNSRPFFTNNIYGRLPEAAADVLTGKRVGIYLHFVAHPYRVPSQGSETAECRTIVTSEKSKRVHSPYSTGSAVIGIFNKVFQHELLRFSRNGNEMQWILMVPVCVVDVAKVMTVKRGNEFIPAQQFTPHALVSYQANTATAIAHPAVLARYIMASVLAACRVNNSGENNNR